MFTGIITHQAKIVHVDQGVFTIQSPFETLPTIGQSIAHDGACMSVTAVNTLTNTYSFFTMQESFVKTNFATKTIGDSFNIELCMTAGDRLDGHFVTGHIDTTGSLTQRQFAEDGSLQLTIQYDPKRSRLLLPKGSIALNGVSLTLVDVTDSTFSVRLIPLTQSDTNLGSLQIGASLNLEFDILGKYVLKSQGIIIE